MGKRDGTKRVITAAAAGLSAVCAVLWCPGEIGGEMQGRIAELLLEKSQRMYMTGIVYAGGRDTEAAAPILSGVQKLFPLGAYVERGMTPATDVEDAATYERILASQSGGEESGKGAGPEEKDSSRTDGVRTSGTPLDTSIEKMKDFDYVISNFYTVDGTTMIREDELKAAELLKKNMKLREEEGGPKILIYHTHSQEMFADSRKGDEDTSIVGIGAYLAELLNETYQIPTLHHKGVYDLIDGKLDRSLAYDMAKPDLQKILEENPGIEVVIDLHRDGVSEGTHLVTEVNGKQTAQIMFFNGLSKTRANGEIDYLANPYIQENLAFSLQMQVAANEVYPGFARRIYLRGYRYNMHFMPKSLLVEAGAQTNTVEEMKNAMEVLADLLHTVLVG